MRFLQKLKNFAGSILPPLIGGLVWVVLFLTFYQEDRIILGSEGSYFLDFPLLFQNFAYSWYNAQAGVFAASLNFGYVWHLIFLQNILGNEKIVNFLIIYLIYFLPFLAIYLVAHELRLPRFPALLIAVFYVTNPFTSNFLKSINQWNMLAVYILPAFFFVIFKFYHKNWLLFLIFGLHSLVFSFTNANPPTMVLYQLALPFFVFLASLYKEQTLKIKVIAKKYILLFSSFVLFNLWWIINLFYVFFDFQRGYSTQFAISWLRGSGRFAPEFWRTLNLTTILQYPIDPKYDYFAQHYSLFYTPLLLSIPILIFIYFLFKDGLRKKHYLLLGLMLILVALFSKGVNGLFGGIYEFMVLNLPIFSIFKSAAEKWGVLFIFLLTLCLIFAFVDLKKDKLYPFILLIFITYTFYTAIPFITRNFLPEAKVSDVVRHSKKFIDKVEYQDLRKELNNDPLQYRVLSLPGSLNYQIALWIEGRKFFTGLDPILNNTNKPFLAPYNGTFTQRFDELFNSISRPGYLNLLGLYNIKKIVINKNMYPWFGFAEKENIPEIEEILDKNLKSSKNEVIDLYDIGDYYLPRFYVPQSLIYSPINFQNDLPTIVGLTNFPARSAIFFTSGPKTVRKGQFENNFVKDQSSQTLLVADLQSAINEEKLRAGIEGMNPGGVLFPYVRWKPGSFIYSYVEEKEQRVKQEVGDNPELLLERHLFFAAKRISEVQKWDRELNDSQFSEILNNYRNEMEETIKNLNAARIEGKDTFLLLAKIEVSFEAHKTRLLDILKGDYAGSENERVKLAKMILNEIDKELKDLVKKEYLQTKYYFNLSQAGEYEILVAHPGISPEWKIENITTSPNDRFIVSALSQQDDKNWLSFGKRQFNAGDQFLIFIKPPSPNLLNNNWKNLEGNIEFGEEIKLSLQEDSPGVYQDIQTWEPWKTYKFSFKYKTDDAQIKILLIERKNDKIDTTWFDRGILDKPPEKTNVLLEETLESGNEWGEFSRMVNSGRNVGPARLSIFGHLDFKKLGSIEFKEVRIEEVIEPRIILRKMDGNNLDAPEITFTKINPTKYVIDVENAASPYFLVFSESFHRGWKAYISKQQTANSKQQNNNIVASYFDGEIKEGRARNIFLNQSTFETWGKKSLPDDRHIVMNGYANSWFITPEDADGRSNYQIIIEYWPQRLFYGGAFVTALTILAMLIIGLTKILKSKERLT